ncbi:unnamed protein product [Clonostachys solani]|uniref:CHK kinase-like domain-containing protein n=1 Tax=Clonostachys solani TaxID=160281 RepID=A0A9N9Z2K8_9HYPO|nr:unnamed protein product [Clonostachys solani]
MAVTTAASVITTTNTPLTLTTHSSEIFLPLVPEDVTKEWLALVLGLKIKSVRKKDEIHGTASKLVFLITYDESETATDKPTSVFVKGGFNPDLKAAMPLFVAMYRREVRFFNEIAPKISNMNLLRSWWAAENSDQGIIVMEDLGEKSYTFSKATEPWGPELVKRAIAELAILHAATWGQGRKEYPWLTLDYDDIIMAMFPGLPYSEFVKDPEHPPLPENMRDSKRVEAYMAKYFATRNPKYQCLVHGDAHLMNISIAPDGAVGMIDWQLIHGGSCFHDIAYLIAGSMKVEDRREHEMSLLEYYFECLHKNGGPKFSTNEEDTMVEYKRSHITGFGWICTTTKMHPLENIWAMVPRFIAAIEDHKVVDLIESM